MTQEQELSPRTILSIDTSQPSLGLALFRGSDFLASIQDDSGLPHSQQLFPLLEKSLRSSGLMLTAIDVFVINTGPGSFTGLRVGLAAVKGLASTLGKPVWGMNALDALAYETGMIGVPIVVILNASRGEIFLGVRELLTDGAILTRGHDRVLPMSQVVEVVNDEWGDQAAVFIGSGATILWPQLQCRANRRFVAVPVSLAETIARWASVEAKRKQDGNVEAYYIRCSDAEIKKQNE